MTASSVRSADAPDSAPTIGDPGPPIVLVACLKGGVGKSSIVANVSVAIARKGRRVAVFDVDQQGNLTTEDLGVPTEEWDNGRHLASTLQFGMDLKPYKNVRPNLDVFMGGPSLGLVATSAQRAADAGIDIADNLRQALKVLYQRESYDIIFVDAGHGDVTLLLALLQVCTHLVVPTREDSGSMKGVEQLAASYVRARKERGSTISLLGVVLFETNPRAKKRNEYITKCVSEILQGSNAKPFTAAIRHAPKQAIATRERHLTAQELELAISNGDHQKPQESGNDDSTRLRPGDCVPLANDYIKLAGEILKLVFTPVHASA
jgi:chromosome partitioning protein